MSQQHLSRNPLADLFGNMSMMSQQSSDLSNISSIQAPHSQSVSSVNTNSNSINTSYSNITGNSGNSKFSNTSNKSKLNSSDNYSSHILINTSETDSKIPSDSYEKSSIMQKGARNPNFNKGFKKSSINSNTNTSNNTSNSNNSSFNMISNSIPSPSKLSSLDTTQSHSLVIETVNNANGLNGNESDIDSSRQYRISNQSNSQASEEGMYHHNPELDRHLKMKRTAVLGVMAIVMILILLWQKVNVTAGMGSEGNPANNGV